MSGFEREQQVAEQAARAAGAIIHRLYDQAYEVREKSRDNPVTEADLLADQCIREIIHREFPADGWLSEETKDSADRLRCERVWIVDPLDGTKEFIQHVPELCVCIALVENGNPVVGVEYNPITDELFSCSRGRGVTLNGSVVRVSDCADVSQARMLASRSEDKRGEWDAFKPHMQVVLTGSVAYKLARIAAGWGDGTFSLTPKHEWDVCAGAALISEGGGKMTDCYGQPLRFNQPKPKLPGLIATNQNLYDPIRKLIAELNPRP